VAEKRLVVDASVLVGELLRSRGRLRLREPRLELVVPDQMVDETEAEIPRRAALVGSRRGLTGAEVADLVDKCFALLRSSTTLAREAIYAAAQDEARARCLRDPTDWPVVATALIVDGEIWTNDKDFLGVGVATWTTETLQGWLDRNR